MILRSIVVAICFVVVVVAGVPLLYHENLSSMRIALMIAGILVGAINIPQIVSRPPGPEMTRFGRHTTASLVAEGERLHRTQLARFAERLRRGDVEEGDDNTRPPAA